MRFAFPWLSRAALALALALGGCAHVPPSSLAQLAQLDIMTADLKVLRAAVRAPAGIVPEPGGAKLVLTYWRDGGEKTSVSAALVEDTAPGALANLKGEETPGSRITVFRIPEPERVRLDAARAAIAAAKAKEEGGRRTHGTLSVSVDGCAREALPEGALLLSTYLKITPDGDFFPLVKDIDLRSLTAAAGAEGGALKRCAS